MRWCASLSERMRVSLGQPLVVEYVTGAAGMLGVGRVARAAPDGYTMLIGHLGTNVVVPALYSLPFDVLEGFRAGRAAAQQPVPAGRPQHAAGGRQYRDPGDKPHRAGGLDQAEPGQGVGRHAGRQFAARTWPASNSRT